MKNSLKTLLFSVGLVAVCFAFAPPPAQGADNAGNIVLAQNDTNRGFFGFFRRGDDSGSQSSSETRKQPVYTTTGNQSSAGRSAVTGIYGGAADNRQARTDAEKAAVYKLPPARPVDPGVSAGARMQIAQERVARTFSGLEEKRKRNEALIAAQEQGYETPRGMPQQQTERPRTPENTRVLYNREPDSGRQPIRLFDVR